MLENLAPYISLLIFFTTFSILILEKIDRTVISFFGATVMLGVGHLGGFYHFDQAANAIDFNTVLLLFGMMIIVAEFEKSGFFQYIAIKVAKRTKGSLWMLTLLLGTLASVLSMILDNVTTIIMLVPITLILTKIMKLNPIPILISEAILSNIGGVATLVGDPPNILIGSAAGFSFNTFLTHSFPVVLVAWLGVLFYIRFSYRKEFQEPAKNIKCLMKMDEHKMIKEPIILKKSLWVLGGVIFMFLVHGYFKLPPSYVAVLGAAFLIMIVSPHKDPKSIFKKVELSVLVFFVSLFVLVGGLEASGVLEYISSFIIEGASNNILLTAIILLWVSAIISSLIDNIPMTVAMIPIIGMLQAKGIYGVELLWWALVFGVGFGGNATPIGSTAGVVVTAKASSNKTPISTKEWMKNGVPATIIALLVATYMLIVFYKYFM